MLYLDENKVIDDELKELMNYIEYFSNLKTFVISLKQNKLTFAGV